MFKSNLESWQKVRFLSEIVIVNWKHCATAFQSFIQQAAESDHRILFISVNSLASSSCDQNTFVHTRALNIAARFASGDMILRVDCTTELSPEFLTANRITNRSSVFLSSSWSAAKDEFEQELRHVLLVSKHAFDSIGGYDERMIHSGFEEADIAVRLQFQSLQFHQLNLSTLRSKADKTGDDDGNGRRHGVWKDISIPLERWGVHRLRNVPLKVAIQINAIGKERAGAWIDQLTHPMITKSERGTQQFFFFINAPENTLFSVRALHSFDDSNRTWTRRESIENTEPNLVVSVVELCVNESLEAHGFMDALPSISERAGRVALAYERVLHDSMRVSWDVLVQLSFEELVDMLDFMVEMESGGEAYSRVTFVSIEASTLVQAVHDFVVSLAYCIQNQVVCIVNLNVPIPVFSMNPELELLFQKRSVLDRKRDSNADSHGSKATLSTLFDIHAANRALILGIYPDSETISSALANRNTKRILETDSDNTRNHNQHKSSSDDESIELETSALLISLKEWKCRCGDLHHCSKWDRAYEDIDEIFVESVLVSDAEILLRMRRQNYDRNNQQKRHQLLRFSSSTRTFSSERKSESEDCAVQESLVRAVMSNVLEPTRDVQEYSEGLGHVWESVGVWVDWNGTQGEFEGFEKGISEAVDKLMNAEDKTDEMSRDGVYTSKQKPSYVVVGSAVDVIDFVREREKELLKEEEQDEDDVDGAAEDELGMISSLNYSAYQRELARNRVLRNSRKNKRMLRTQETRNPLSTKRNNALICIEPQCSQRALADIFAALNCRSLVSIADLNNTISTDSSSQSLPQALTRLRNWSRS